MDWLNKIRVIECGWIEQEMNRNQENGMNNDVWIDSGIKAWMIVVEWAII